MNYKIQAYALQDIGQRDNQEDCFYPAFIDPCHYDAVKREWSFYDGTAHTDGRCFIVCDGMGGHDRGEVASQTVIQSMSTFMKDNATVEGTFDDQLLKDAVSKALDDLEALDDPMEKKKMGTTMVLLKFHSEGATVGHIGDSRLYHFRPARYNDNVNDNENENGGSQIMFCTEDHRYEGHVLSRAMTSAKNYRPEVEINHITDIRPGDIFFLCSDGIYESMDDAQLCKLVCDPNNDDAETVQRVLDATKNNRDNHTAIFVRVQDVYNNVNANAKDNRNNNNNSSETLSPGMVITSKNYTYTVEKVLGHGAFGITYLVNTSVAMQGPLGTIHTEVKMCMKEFFMHGYMKRVGTEIDEASKTDRVKDFAVKFRNEATKIAMFSHPHIVRVLEVFEANNTIYYSMEYLPDGSLNDYINKKDGLSEKEAIRYIRQIGSALNYMHTNKVLHLDVKPANVMRVGDDDLKLIDFGLAKRYEENGNAMSSAILGSGTSGYAPLEQSDQHTAMPFSPQMDVYALGATYYKTLTGMVPDNAIDVLNNGLRTMPLVRRHISQKSIDAIKAAMEPMTSKRLKSVQEFLDMLPRLDDDVFYEDKKKHSFWKWLGEVFGFTLE